MITTRWSGAGASAARSRGSPDPEPVLNRCIYVYTNTLYLLSPPLVSALPCIDSLRPTTCQKQAAKSGRTPDRCRLRADAGRSSSSTPQARGAGSDLQAPNPVQCCTHAVGAVMVTGVVLGAHNLRRGKSKKTSHDRGRLPYCSHPVKIRIVYCRVFPTGYGKLRTPCHV